MTSFLKAREGFFSWEIIYKFLSNLQFFSLSSGRLKFAFWFNGTFSTSKLITLRFEHIPPNKKRPNFKFFAGFKNLFICRILAGLSQYIFTISKILINGSRFQKLRYVLLGLNYKQNYRSRNNSVAIRLLKFSLSPI